jgi:O-antigen/teichoic acid export membrane protein
MSGIRWALAVTTAERYLSMALHFAMTIVISRLLTPAEIGVWAIGLATATTALALREFASGNYLIQRADLSQDDVRGAFTVMLLVSLAIAAAIVIASSAIAAFYNEARLMSYLRVAAVAIVFEVIGAPLIALMRRNMAFGDIAVINIANAVIFAGLSVTLAALGFSYMSFAWAWAAAAAVSGALTIYYRPDFWVFRPTLGQWRDMLKFGGYNGANVFLYRLYEAVPAMVLGRLVSFDAVGLYNRALLVCQLPDRIILGGAASVILPTLSAEVRAGGDLRDTYLRAVSFITGLQWPAIVVIGILAHAVVRILLGDQWLGVVDLVQIIAVASFFSFFSELNIPVLMAVGGMRDVLLRGLVAWPISAVLMACTAPFGLTAAAMSLLVIIPFQAYVSIYFVRRHVRVEWSELGAVLWRSAQIAAATALGPLCVVAASGFRFDLSIPAAMVGGVLAGAGWLVAIRLTRHPLLDEVQIAWQALRKLRRRVPNQPMAPSGGPQP